MAVQIPDPGTGNGQTGDNEYVFRKKVKDNFSDQTNAASKLVGTGTGQIPLAEDTRVVVFSRDPVAMNSGDANDFALGSFTYAANSTLLNIPYEKIQVLSIKGYANSVVQLGFSYSDSEKKGVMVRNKKSGSGGGWAEWMPVGQSSLTYTETIASGANVVVDATGKLMRSTSIAYTNTNTTKDSNGFIKAASPIVKVFADKVELNGEAVDQDVTYKKNGVGDYTITTVSGLSTDGWYIELPKDMNGNPKVAVTLTEVDGVISLKTYKRIFSMETFTFEPDLEQPLDIPDTRWIDLRLNEIPVEIEDDTQMEV